MRAIEGMATDAGYQARSLEVLRYTHEVLIRALDQEEENR